MISYEPFWEYMKNNKITTYRLIHKLGISNGTLYRMRKGNNISTNTLNDICVALDCDIHNIIAYVKDENEKKGIEHSKF